MITFFEKCEKLNLPVDGKIRQPDLRYYINLREQLEFKIDHAKLQQYFPIEVVLNFIMSKKSWLFGSLFREIANHGTHW